MGWSNKHQYIVCLLLPAICACGPTISEKPSAQNVPVTPDATDLPSGKPSARDVKRERAEAYEDVPEGELIVHHAMTGELADDGWCTASPSRGDFSVELPGRYVDQMIKSLGKEGYPGGVMHTVMTFTEDNIEFSVLQTELFGERRDEDIVKETTQGLQDKGAEVKQVDVTLDGRPARKLIVTHPSKVAEMVFLQGDHSDYLLGVQFDPSLRDTFREDIDRFYRSFKIIAADQ